MVPGPLEITDLLWPVDADGVLIPVLKADVLDRLKELGQRRAARIVSAFPSADGILACYATLNWRFRYLASALILGPLTLLRPAIAILGAAAGATVSHDTVVAIVAMGSAIAVLAVEPLAGRLWYARSDPGPAS